MRHALLVAIALVAALVTASCAGPGSVGTTEVVAVVRDQLPTASDDGAWDDVPLHVAALLLQDMVEPRLLEVSTPTVEVRAVTDGRRVAFKLSWKDATQDDLPGASRFVDSCAVQLPSKTEADVPAPQMGEKGRLVEIAYWRSSWQAVVDGREDVIRALYPNATTDHYPFEAPSLDQGSDTQKSLATQYAPARSLDNTMAGPRERPVEDLLAEGPGTLSRADDQWSEATGRRVDRGWEVVIVRPLPRGLNAGQRSQIAFAVWDGARGEVGARKMRSAWIPLHVQGEG